MAPNRFDLKPFDRRWAQTVLGWITSSEELRHWSGRTDFPLLDSGVFDQWHGDPDVAAYVLSSEDSIVAYGEIWHDEAEGSAEVGRLVVSPDRRRQGLGRLLIESLAGVAHKAGCGQIWVRVFPTNAPALACYVSAGFTRAPNEQQAALNAAQRFEFVWMVRMIHLKARGVSMEPMP